MSCFGSHEENPIFRKRVLWGRSSVIDDSFHSFLNFWGSSWRSAHHLKDSKGVNGKVVSLKSKLFVVKLGHPLFGNLSVNCSLQFGWVGDAKGLGILIDQISIVEVADCGQVALRGRWEALQSCINISCEFALGALEKGQGFSFVVNGLSRGILVKFGVLEPLADRRVRWALGPQKIYNLPCLDNRSQRFLSLSGLVGVLVIRSVHQLFGDFAVG